VEEQLSKIYESVLIGDQQETMRLVQDALAQGQLSQDILFKAMIPAMDEVGRLYEEGEYFIPEMLVAARAMHSGQELLKPHLKGGGIQSLGKVAIGTVKGDLHDIGKNLVSMMLEGAGFEIQDLGVDVGPEKFVQAIQDGAQIVGFSALLTTTMSQMKLIVDAIQASGLREKVKIMIGGAPITQNYANSIGADGYATDASTAVELARNLIRK